MCYLVDLVLWNRNDIFYIEFDFTIYRLTNKPTMLDLNP